MKALVTGAGGFVGANLVRHLLHTGHEPVGVVRPDGDRWRLADIADTVELAAVDLHDRESVRALVHRHRPEAIFHLAARGAYSWQQDLDAMLAVNFSALQSLLDAAHEIGAGLVNAGSSSEYGYQDHPPREDEPVRPNSHYAVTKVAATHLCQLAAATTGQRAVTLRLYSVYGPWEEPGRLMPTLVRHCLAGEWPPLVGPQTARDFVWVDDACEAFVAAATTALDNPGAIFNIASGTQTTLAMLVDRARRLFAVEREPVWGTMPARAWDTSIWVGDPRAAASGLSWVAATSLDDGLQRLAGWLSEHPEIARRYDGDR